MRKLILVLVLIALAISANAVVANWNVATVHGAYQFDISNNGSQLEYLEQLRNTSMFWFNNNGSAPGVLATGGGGPNGERTGIKTFAMTNVAYGMPLNTIKLSFAYYSPALAPLSPPNPNFFITDGRGIYGIWSPDSGGSPATEVRNGDWVTRTFDLTTIADESTGYAIYEHNGIAATYEYPFNTMNWADIKNFKIAGFYGYQRSPHAGWDSWSNSFANVSATWNAIVIRKSSGGNAPAINNIVSGGVPAKEFVISEGGMKAAWGTSALDGKKVSEIGGYISRLDSNTGSSPYGPYFNIWITDGNGNFAVIANEPSDAEWTGAGFTRHNFDWNDLKTKVAKIYEFSGAFTKPAGTTYTFSSFANYTILAPTPAQLATGWTGLGTGAPREIVTNKAFGFNWVFGDTLSNYVNGYIASNPAVTKNGAVNNEYGITLNWGDTVGPYSRHTTIKDVVLTAGGVDYSANFQADQLAPNMLSLDATNESLYVKTGESILIDMNIAGLTQEVSACQAILGFDSGLLNVGTVTPGGTVWDNLIAESWTVSGSNGKINTAIGVYGNSTLGTSADGTVAKIMLTAKSVEGTTQMVFAPDVSDIEGTFLSDGDGNAIWPTKVNSQNIIIDGTAPVLSIDSVTQNGNAIGTAVKGSVVITITASDALAGLVGDPVVTVKDSANQNIAFSKSGNVYTATITALTPNGTCTITAVATDKAGNAITKTATFEVNKNEIAGTITIPGFVGGSRDVTFVLNHSTTTTKTLTFAGETASFSLENIQNAVTSISAKTAWTLRKQVDVTMVDGQVSGVSLTLLGGDLNNTNSINILDYSILKSIYFTTNAVADINGDNEVHFTDYYIMKANWLTTGDAQ